MDGGHGVVGAGLQIQQVPQPKSPEGIIQGNLPNGRRIRLHTDPAIAPALQILKKLEASHPLISIAMHSIVPQGAMAKESPCHNTFDRMKACLLRFLALFFPIGQGSLSSEVKQAKAAQLATLGMEMQAFKKELFHISNPIKGSPQFERLKKDLAHFPADGADGEHGDLRNGYSDRIQKALQGIQLRQQQIVKMEGELANLQQQLNELLQNKKGRIPHEQEALENAIQKRKNILEVLKQNMESMGIDGDIKELKQCLKADFKHLLKLEAVIRPLAEADPSLTPLLEKIIRMQKRLVQELGTQPLMKE